MRLLIDIPKEMYYNAAKGLLMGGDLPLLNEIIAHGFVCNLPQDAKRDTDSNITDEQISDAFQIAIANYWEEKSKHLTPPPTPCNCPTKDEIRWTDKVTLDADGNIRDFNGNIYGTDIRGDV